MLQGNCQWGKQCQRANGIRYKRPKSPQTGLEGIWSFLTETTALHTGTDMLSSQGHCRGGASRGSNAKEQVGGAARGPEAVQSGPEGALVVLAEGVTFHTCKEMLSLVSADEAISESDWELLQEAWKPIRVTWKVSGLECVAIPRILYIAQAKKLLSLLHCCRGGASS